MRPPLFPELDLDALIARALDEQARLGVDEPGTYLVALHQRPSRETFAKAAALVRRNGAERQLGLRILKELGQSERPFADETLDLLLPEVERARSAEDFRELVSAIGWQRSTRALPLLCSWARHEDVLVRFLVAQHLPACMPQADDQADPRVVEALLRLVQDDDSDVRYYAVTVFADDYPALDGAGIRAALAARADDIDEQVREAARRALADRSAS